MIVVDASIAVKWFIDEPDSAVADDFLTQYEGELAAPSFLVIEVSRALVAAINARRIARDAGRTAITAWLSVVDAGHIVLFEADRAIVDRSVEIALALGHPLPDCLYLALALDLKCDLATADRIFARRASSRYDNIKLIAAPDARLAPAPAIC